MHDATLLPGDHCGDRVIKEAEISQNGGLNDRVEATSTGPTDIMHPDYKKGYEQYYYNLQIRASACRQSSLPLREVGPFLDSRSRMSSSACEAKRG